MPCSYYPLYCLSLTFVMHSFCLSSCAGKLIGPLPNQQLCQKIFVFFISWSECDLVCFLSVTLWYFKIWFPPKYVLNYITFIMGKWLFVCVCVCARACVCAHAHVCMRVFYIYINWYLLNCMLHYYRAILHALSLTITYSLLLST